MIFLELLLKKELMKLSKLTQKVPLRLTKLNRCKKVTKPMRTCSLTSSSSMLNLCLLSPLIILDTSRALNLTINTLVLRDRLKLGNQVIRRGDQSTRFQTKKSLKITQRLVKKKRQNGFTISQDIRRSQNTILQI
jgi:hypothetical protein